MLAVLSMVPAVVVECIYIYIKKLYFIVLQLRPTRETIYPDFGVVVVIVGFGALSFVWLCVV